MNRSIVTFSLLTALAACNTPTLNFSTVEPIEVVVDGSVFDVRVKGERAEAIRTNPQQAWTMQTIRPKAIRAIEIASGCNVVSFAGDQSLSHASLAC